MAFAFLTGTITSGSSVLAAASISSRTLSIASLDGTFIGVVQRAGTYTLVAHAPGFQHATIKVPITKLDGKHKQVRIRLKALKAG